MKKIYFVIFIAFTMINCKQESKKTNDNSGNKQVISDTTLAQKHTGTNQQDDGYTLMKQFCFTCHIEKPDPSKRDNMLAPPMRNVQQHYKSTFPQKDEFIKAVISWVNKPDENKVLMPGAVRRFNLMPPLPIGDDKIKSIAEVLYEKDFGKMNHGKRMFKDKHAATGEKQKLNPADIAQIHSLANKLNQTKPETVEAFRQLGKEVFDGARGILLNKNYQGDVLQQIQFFFHGIEGDMHNLMSVNTVEEGKKYQKILQEKFKDFDKYFK